jgi:protein O-mannosyl-transferase
VRRKHKPSPPVVACDLGRHEKSPFRAAAAVGCLLVAAVAIVFGQTVQHGFVNYDDNVYISENPRVQSGLTADGINWALTTSDCCLWAPLTWTSYLLNFQLCGVQPWGYHLTNVLLHAASAVVLFFVLWRATGRLWPSALAAAVFAVHPLQAESVAWVAERKGLLSGLFFLLTVAAYLRYVGRPFSAVRYLAVVALFALGLMSKPMVVTLPLVLLLLDYWPLQRIGQAAAPSSAPRGVAGDRTGTKPLRALLVEKTPLFLLAAVSCITTPLTQAENLTGLQTISVSSRVVNALQSYVVYLGDFVWPTDLATGYPHPKGNVSLGVGAAVLVFLAAVSLLAAAARRRLPYLLVGWLWFLAMLVPVIGLVQVGLHARADRYMYLPLIGLGIVVAWGAADLLRSWSVRGWIGGAASALILAALAATAWRQTTFWRNSETLWRHALACTVGNSLAHRNLGSMLVEQRGRGGEAVEQYRAALAIDPDDAPINAGLAGALAVQGRSAEAIRYAERALAIQPECVDAHNNIGIALAMAGRFDEAIERFEVILKLRPDYARAGRNMQQALRMRETAVASLDQRREAVRRNPNDVAMLSDTAWQLACNPNASVRNGREAFALAARAVELSREQDAAALDALAAAYAETGQFSTAAQTARKALTLARQQNNRALVEAIRARIAQYEAKEPFRQSDLRPDGL